MLSRFALMLISCYQKVISPYLRSCQCRYYPSCSCYAAEAIKRYGIFRGAIKTVFRLLRCNPFSNGGIDFP